MSSEKKPALKTIKQLQSRLSSAKERGRISSFHSPRSAKNPHPGKWVLNDEPFDDLSKYLAKLLSVNVINGTEMNVLLLAPSEPKAEAAPKRKGVAPRGKLQDLALNAQLKALLRRLKGPQLMELDVECVGMLTKLVAELREYTT